MRPFLLIVLTLAACGSPTAEAGTGAVATAYPLAWLVAEIAPDLELTSLASRGQDPHDLELTPQQRATLETAGLVVYLGDMGFQPQVEAAMPSAQGEVVSALDVLGKDQLRPIAGGHEEDGEHDEAEGTEHDEGTDAEHDEGAGIDPHLWFDATLMAELATAVGQAAADADPSGAQEYARKAAATAGILDDLADEISTMLSNCSADTVIVSHEAYQYLLEPADLEQHGISGAGGHSEASPSDIADLAAEIRAEGLPAVLTEPVEGRTDAEAVAAEAGVDLIEIYSLDVVDEEQAAKGFPQLLREQAAAVAQAAGCG